MRDRHVDAVVSGLALNFVPDLPGALAEIARATSPGGVAAAYVWDYADGMEMIRYFWDAAVSLDPAAGQLDEGPRFPVCQPGPLRGVWETAGFGEVTVRPIEVPTVFTGFGDFWEPFLGGQGPAPGYVSSLVPKDRRALEHLLRRRLPAGPDGTIPLRARAWAVRGRA